jgi:hypothetical protein
MKPMFIHIIKTLEKSEQWRETNDIRMKNVWNSMQWLRKFNNIDTALEQLRQLMNTETEQTELTNALGLALRSYLTPSDTLIYRFTSENNKSLLTNSHFVQLARAYLNTIGMVTKDFRFFL